MQFVREQSFYRKVGVVYDTQEVILPIHPDFAVICSVYHSLYLLDTRHICTCVLASGENTPHQHFLSVNGKSYWNLGDKSEMQHLIQILDYISLDL